MSNASGSSGRSSVIFGGGSSRCANNDREVGLPLERTRPGEALIEHAAERIDIGAAVERATRDLLGRNVVDRSDEAALTRQAAHGRHVSSKTEGADVGVLLSVGPEPDEDVARLDIAMDESSSVSCIKCACRLAFDREQCGPRRAVLLHAGLGCFAAANANQPRRAGRARRHAGGTQGCARETFNDAITGGIVGRTRRPCNEEDPPATVENPSQRH